MLHRHSSRAMQMCSRHTWRWKPSRCRADCKWSRSQWGMRRRMPFRRSHTCMCMSHLFEEGRGCCRCCRDHRARCSSTPSRSTRTGTDTRLLDKLHAHYKRRVLHFQRPDLRRTTCSQYQSTRCRRSMFRCLGCRTHCCFKYLARAIDSRSSSRRTRWRNQKEKWKQSRPLTLHPPPQK